MGTMCGLYARTASESTRCLARCASRCVQLACCKPDPQRFRIANTSPTVDSMSARELGSGVATAVNVKVPQLKAKSLPERPPHTKPPPPSSVSWKVNLFGMGKGLRCANANHE